MVDPPPSKPMSSIERYPCGSKVQFLLVVQVQYLRMSVNETKFKLPRLLNRFTIKLKALFLQKLELYHKEESLSRPIRLYDLQCEATQILIGFYKNKKQNTLLRAFDALLQHYHQVSAPKPTRRTDLNSTARNTTIRTGPNTVRTPQTSQRGNPFLINQNLSTYTPMRAHPNNLTFISDNTPVRQTHSALGSYREPKGDLTQLLSRVRQANYSQHDCSYSFRDGGQSYFRLARPQRLRTNVTDNDRREARFSDGDMFSRRSSRRQFILEKFNQIEQRLDRVGAGQIGREVANLKQRLRL